MMFKEMIIEPFMSSILDIHELLEGQEIHESPVVKHWWRHAPLTGLSLISDQEIPIMLGNDLISVLFDTLFGHLFDVLFIFLMSVNCLLMTQDSGLAI